MDCVAAIDQGTQSTRVFLYNASAEPIASHQEEFKQIYPKKGWCEHDPSIIWGSVQRCIEKALVAAHSKFGSVAVKAVGITNQRETTLVWRRSTGKPCCNAIVWLDTRTREICKELEGKWGRECFRGITGLPLSTYFSALKVKWMYENEEDVRQAMDCGDAMIGTIDSWIIYNLTGATSGGAHVTDVSNASRTCLMDLKALAWSPECLKKFGIKESALPAIHSNSEVLGYVAAGPLKGVPISGCLGDQQAALLGQHCVEGQGKNTYGTGCFLLVHTGVKPVSSSSGLLSTIAYQLGPQEEAGYALEGSIAIAGMAVAWLRDQLGLITSVSECEDLAASVEDTGGVYFVPAFSGLLAPHWRDDARGALLGMTQFTNKGHIVRAVLEGVAWQTRDVLEAIRKDSGQAVSKLRVDGGATKNNLLMQIQADIAQVQVERPAFQETTSLGAAYAAGLAVGFYSRKQVLLHDNQETVCVFQPKAEAASVEQRYASWKRAVVKSFDCADL